MRRQKIAAVGFVKVRQNFESAISRFGLRGAEADAWLVKSMAAIRDRVLEIEASRAIAQEKP
jgi:hypothetical protein